MRPSTHRYSCVRVFAAVLVGVLMGWSFAARAVETVTYYHLDALGSPVAATDASGNVVWREAYRPYGARINMEPAAANQSRWYTGHPHDEDSGLTYAGARYYDPVVGRFMGVDPVGVGEGNVHSFNRYAYGNNNPYKFVDPDGEVAQAIAGGFWGGLVDVATQGVLIATGVQESFSYTQFATSVGTGALTAGLSTAGNIAKLGNALTKLRAGGSVTKGAGKEIGILRDAAKGKGNFGLGSGSRAEADKLGRAWVGDGARVASDGKTLVSKDGLKVFRPPSAKPNSPHATTGVQANFERKIEVGGRPISNGHLDIVD